MVEVAAASGFPVSAVNARIAYDKMMVALDEMSPLYIGEEAQELYEKNVARDNFVEAFAAVPADAFGDPFA